jgi:hypothetical protein
MEHHYLQLFMSLALILTAAVVAFICDLLKRNNEQLREINIELKTRQEEEQKRTHVPAPRPSERVMRTEKAAPAPAPPVVAPVAAPKERSITHKDAHKEKKRTVNAEAIAAMERGAALAGSGKRPRSAAPVPEVRVEWKQEVMKHEVEVPAVKQVEAKQVEAKQVEAKQVEAKQVEVKQAEVPQQQTAALAVIAKPEFPAPLAAAKKDWGSLLSRNAQGIKTLPASTMPEPSTPALPAGFQTGFHDGFVLNKLVQSHQPITGLVVSIGVNAAGKSNRKLPESVAKLVESLIGPEDFAAQSGEDEFLLIFPRERGASAQRRLTQIAEQLWDFQLRSLGSFQILFSWGGVEVRAESIEEAIASASERMQETKRGRKLLPMEPAEQLKKAV